jgi:2'-deoxycytidine 5'-triphosphate deaminase (DCD)
MQACSRMAGEPDVLYGADVGSNYQGQKTMLSKRFTARADGPAPSARRGDRETLEPTARVAKP